MAYFNRKKKKTIILPTEDSIHERLNAARRQQPVKAEKQYSHTGKDALAVKWALARCRNYLIGAQ